MNAQERAERDAAIVRLSRDSGLLQREIAESLGTDQGSVSRVLRHLGEQWENRTRQSSRATDRDPELLRLWSEGFTLAQVAEQLDLGVGAVRYRLKVLGAQARRVSRAHKAQDARDNVLRTLWANESLTIDDIARALGVRASSVPRSAQRLGLPARKRGRKKRA